MRFYVLHCFFLPALVLLLFSYHMWRIRKDGGLACVDNFALAQQVTKAVPSRSKTYSLLGITGGSTVHMETALVNEEEHTVQASPNLTRRLLAVTLATGKLQSITTAFNMEKILTAIQNKDFSGDEDGIPVPNYDKIKDAEVNVGLGPLHTQFDDQGFAYTSLFVESAVAKWKLGTWEVLDKIPVTYNIGHLAAAKGDTAHPAGRFLVALNKLSHGRHFSVGPSQPECSQLIDIGGEKMKLLYDAFTEREPHYAQIIKAERLKPIEVYAKEENKNPNAIWDVKDVRVDKSGSNVTVKMLAVRSSFEPSKIDVNQGDKVTIHITNIEQTTDELHGLGINEYNINIVIDPGETKTVEFVASKPGVFPFYCTNFCSALHQEMQGYLLVKPK